MEFGVGSVLEGKVTGITKFGAFVALPEGKSGLVHISEIAYSYVNDIKDHLTEGQTVKVKVIGIDDSNRINLSIKKALPPPPRPQGARPQGGARFNSGNSGSSGRPQSGGRSGSFGGRTAASSREPASFEDRLKQFMADSDSRQSDLNRGGDRRGSRRGGRRGG